MNKMAKGVGKFLIVLGIFVFLGASFVAFHSGSFSKQITGNSVSGEISYFYYNLPYASKIFVIFYFIALAFVLTYIFVKNRKEKIEENLVPDVEKIRTKK